MTGILISIRPEYAEKILNGTKRFEFRKVRCRSTVDRLVIYSTSPVMEIVGEARVKNIIEDDPEKVWHMTEDGAGITKEFFDHYYEGHDTAIAFELDGFTKYKNAKKLSDFGIKHAPQSFIYLRRSSPCYNSAICIESQQVQHIMSPTGYLRR